MSAISYDARAFEAYSANKAIAALHQRLAAANERRIHREIQVSAAILAASFVVGAIVGLFV